MRLGVVVLCLVTARLPPLRSRRSRKSRPRPSRQKRQSRRLRQRPPAKTAAPKNAKAPKAEPKTKTTVTTPNAAPNPLAASYAALPLAARVSIQADLIMTGDYEGALTGEFNNDAIAAVKAFQKRKGNAETGVLNPKERADLTAAAKPKQTQRGWQVVDDATTGVRVFVPSKMMPQASQIPGGSRWASARGEMAIETFRAAQSGTTLASVFEQMKRPANGRRVISSSMEGNSFEITGLQNLKHLQVYGYAREDEVRGITIMFDQALEGTLPPVATAVKNAFVPFPSGVATPAAKSKVEYASGFAVSADGHIITDREALEGCQILTIAGIGGVDRIAEDKDKGLLLLRVYGARELKPVVLAGESSKAPELALYGIAEPDAQDGGRDRERDARAAQRGPHRADARAGLHRRRRARPAGQGYRHGDAQACRRRRRARRAAGRAHAGRDDPQLPRRAERRARTDCRHGRCREGVDRAGDLREEIANAQQM